jgi:endonuclease/exonuclease/phosphatase family metal-dependent hydrolase
MNAEPNRLRLMTWNIHGAMGRNPRFDLARVVEFVRGHAPDIVALQEIDSRRGLAADVCAGSNPFEVLRHELGRHGVDAHAISTADGHYGQALFSKWPVAASSVHDLSFPEREPRRAICSDVVTPFGPLRVVATHLGLSLSERRSQAKILLGLLGVAGDDANLPAVGPIVAMGDFNDWLWAGSVRRSLERCLRQSTHHRTFPARLPLFELDRIYVSPPARVIASRIDRTASALSDHLPVIADIVMPPANTG